MTTRLPVAPLAPELTNLYKLIQDSALVKSKDTTLAALREFEQILNKAQQFNTEADGAVQKETVRALYRGNRYGFHQFVRNTPNEPLVLWTDARSIVGWFRLKELIYLRETPRNGNVEFRANVFRGIGGQSPSTKRRSKEETVPALDAFPDA